MAKDWALRIANWLSSLVLWQERLRHPNGGVLDLFVMRVTNRVVSINAYGMEEWELRQMLRHIDPEDKYNLKATLYPNTDPPV